MFAAERKKAEEHQQRRVFTGCAKIATLAGRTLMHLLAVSTAAPTVVPRIAAHARGENNRATPYLSFVLEEVIVREIQLPKR